MGNYKNEPLFVVLTNQHALQRPMLVSSMVPRCSSRSSLRLGFYGSPSVRFYGAVGKYTTFRQSSGGERPFLMCGPHCSVHRNS